MAVHKLNELNFPKELLNVVYEFHARHRYHKLLLTIGFGKHSL